VAEHDGARRNFLEFRHQAVEHHEAVKTHIRTLTDVAYYLPRAVPVGGFTSPLFNDLRYFTLNDIVLGEPVNGFFAITDGHWPTAEADPHVEFLIGNIFILQRDLAFFACGGPRWWWRRKVRWRCER
jgi:hypothetical protein